MVAPDHLKREQAMTSDSYTSAEACRMLGISRRTLTNWIASGKVKPTWTAPGENGQHSWSRLNIVKIAARNGIDLDDVAS